MFISPFIEKSVACACSECKERKRLRQESKVKKLLPFLISQYLSASSFLFVHFHLASSSSRARVSAAREEIDPSKSKAHGRAHQNQTPSLPLPRRQPTN
jgi:hypothetical protein